MYRLNSTSEVRESRLESFETRSTDCTSQFNSQEMERYSSAMIFQQDQQAIRGATDPSLMACTQDSFSDELFRLGWIEFPFLRRNEALFADRVGWHRIIRLQVAMLDQQRAQLSQLVWFSRLQTRLFQ